MTTQRVLLFESSEQTCALRLEHVAEVMRPLPMERVAGAPPFVVGVSLIRGMPTPVVDTASLLFGEPGTPSRLIALRLDHRSVALLVDAIIGIRDVDADAFGLPPLLSGPSQMLDALSIVDSELCTVLQAGRLVSQVERRPAESET